MREICWGALPVCFKVVSQVTAEYESSTAPAGTGIAKREKPRTSLPLLSAGQTASEQSHAAVLVAVAAADIEW